MAWTVSVRDRLRSHHVLDSGLVLTGEERLLDVDHGVDALPLAETARPALPLGSRTFVDEDGAICLTATMAPRVRRGPYGVSVLRRTREVRVAGEEPFVWGVLRAMDGERAVAEIVDGRPDPSGARRLLAQLAALGAIDAGPRPIGRFVHSVTKRGALGAPGLSPEGIVALATDGAYRTWPGTPRTGLGAPVPAELAAFHALTRRRRSAWELDGRAIDRAALGALLSTACGVTGAVSVGDTQLLLRAYPSPGALYAVEVYPVVLAVAGLEAGVHHYVSSEDALEHVRPGIGRADLLDAALPAQRPSIEGAAVAICLTGVFSRFERKYGEGGYRILAAEAGHLAQNLVLAATALGLGARPVGGFFDDLLNEVLGLDTDQEQFLLGVVVGHVRPDTGDQAAWQ